MNIFLKSGAYSLRPKFFLEAQLYNYYFGKFVTLFQTNNLQYV